MAAPCDWCQKLREQHGTVSGGVRLGIRKRFFAPEGGQVLEKAPQGCDHSTRPDRKAFGRQWCDSWGCPVQDQDLDLMALWIPSNS